MNPFDSQGVDALLLEGSQAHYAEPSYYSKCYADRRDDIAFYVGHAGPPCKNILEYGCGNGRIAVPLARAGHRVVGVDMSREMLDDFRARLQKLPKEQAARLQLVQGDMRKVQLKERFDLVYCTFNTFLHLYTRSDVERFLARVREHLAPGAQLVFDVSLPMPQELARDPNRPYRIPKMRYPATGELVRYAEYFDYDPVSQVLSITMRFEPHQAPERAWSTLLTHRQFYPRELESLLHYNGFEVDAVLSDFTSEPLSAEADSAVWIAHWHEAPSAERKDG